MSKSREAWDAHCLKWRGRILTGKYGHSCPDWDDLPIDESCPEWPCACFQQHGERMFGSEGEPE